MISVKMSKATSIKGTKCEKIVRNNGDVFIRPKFREGVKFQDEIYADVSGNETEGYSIFTVDKRVGHHLGYKSPGIVPKYKKDIALKKALSWMKQKRAC